MVPKTTEAQALGGSPVPGTSESLPLRCHFRPLYVYYVTLRGRLMVRRLTLDQLMWVQLLPPQPCCLYGGTWDTRRLEEAVSPEMWVRLPPSALFGRHRLAVQDIAPSRRIREFESRWRRLFALWYCGEPAEGFSGCGQAPYLRVIKPGRMVGKTSSCPGMPDLSRGSGNGG